MRIAKAILEMFFWMLAAGVLLFGVGVALGLALAPALGYIGAINSGKTPDAVIGSTRLLPATVTAAMTLGQQNNDLPRTLATLSEMYQQQAEMRLNLVPGVLTPMLIVVMAVLIGTVILGLFLPFIGLIQSLTGSGHK